MIKSLTAFCTTYILVLAIAGITLLGASALTGCTFDGSGVAAGSDDPASDFVCETDRSCQEVGFGCNIYSCNEEARCEVLDTTCEDGQVCTMDGCATAPVAECQEHYECVPDEGCEAAFCTEDGTCESYSCGPSLCESNDDCAADEECDDQGRCVLVDTAECTVDGDCASNEHCSNEVCVADTPASGDLELHCDNVDGTRVTFSGDIKDGIVTSGVGDLPGTPGKVSVAANSGLGSGAYWPSTSSGIDTTHPACDVAVDGDGKWSCTSYLGFGDSVQQFNFVVANSANTHLRYFDLSKWSVTGYCAKASEGGLCSCEALPCSCD